MNISVDKPELELFIQEQVKSGAYASVGEVIEAGLARLMAEPMEDEMTPEDIAAMEESDREFEQGKSLDWKVVSQELRAKYLKK